MPNTIEAKIVDSTVDIGCLVDWLVLHHVSQTQQSPTMYIDLEGIKLSRNGSLSIFTLLIDEGQPTRTVHLIDVHTLGAQAFNTAGTRGRTLKDILQASKIPKVFFDVRNDSDALFAHFGVALKGVQDVQLMQSAMRTNTQSRRHVSGLAKCIERTTFEWHSSDRASWKLAKEKGERLYKAEHGGSYEIFNQRPIPEDIVSYCLGDVQCLPELRNSFWKQLGTVARNLVLEESKSRVAESQTPEYQPHSPSKAIAPWTRAQNRTLDRWHLDSMSDMFSERFSIGGLRE
jgi:exonuclease 3'-5' domain-containing protein 1